jgi:peptidoglycan hydrolase-like protein with peptidoglycan-binding domain
MQQYHSHNSSAVGLCLCLCVALFFGLFVHSAQAITLALSYTTTPEITVTTRPLGYGCFYIKRNLKLGDKGKDVYALQRILNTDIRTQIAVTGPGSYGNETEFFGPATMRAVQKFQELNNETILRPLGLAKGTGFVGQATIRILPNANNCFEPVSQYPTPTPTPTPSPTSTSLMRIDQATVTMESAKRYVILLGANFPIRDPGVAIVFDDIMLAGLNATGTSSTTLTFELPNGFSAFCDCPPNMPCACPMIYYDRNNTQYSVKLKDIAKGTFSNSVNLTIPQ